MNRLALRALKDISRLSPRFIVISVIAGLTSAIYPLISIEISRRIVEQLSFQSDTTQLLQFILIGLGLILVAQTVSGLFNYIHVLEQAELQKKLEISRNLKGIDMAFQYAEDPSIKDLRQKITIISYGGSPSVEKIANDIRDVVQYLCSVIGAMVLIIPAFLYRSDSIYDSPLWILVLMVLLSLAVYFPQRNSRKQKAKIEKFFSENDQANTTFSYLISLIFNPAAGPEIRIFKQQEGIIHWFREISKPGSASAAFLEISFELWGKLERISLGWNQLLTLVLYILIGLKATVGHLPLSYVVAATAALTVMLSALPKLMSILLSLTSDSTGLELHYKYMDLPNQTEVGSIPVEKRLDNDYLLSVEDLSFTYPGTATEVLKDISVSFDVGKSYAIVGENGSGKTTFIKLLTRLYDPDLGEVRLNGISARKYDTKEYYSLFNVVFQDFDLFSFKLGETIAVGADYEEERILETFRSVGFWDRYRSLPKGLETSLNTEFDSEGISLSGGEQQKLALARALYNDGPIYILDEPTSALDPISEFEIYQNFKEMTQGKTTLIISHRLSSCRFSDEILVFDQGRIVQRGSHEELVGVPGKYAELWEAQAQHYREEKIDLTQLGIEVEE